MKMPKYFYFRVHVKNKGTAVEIEDASDVDVAEIVRCKDCKHYDEWLGEMMCTRDGYYRWAMKPSDFCSYGDRKDA